MREFLASALARTLLFLGLFGAATAVADPGSDLVSTNAVADAESALRKFVTAPGLKVELHSSEPLLQNPVSFHFDEQGRCYVVETHRRRTSIFDIRSFPEWVDADFAFRSVADRYRFVTNTLHIGQTNYDGKLRGDHNKDGVKDWRDFEVESERVRTLFDTNNDGRADRAVTLADGFNSVVSGGAAGVLGHGSNIWFTCIPDLWVMTDQNGDGVADERKPLLSGFGVHIAFPGHDLHGLRIGPDGRLYFSIGDRGLNIRTPEGEQIVYPDAGCIMRCNPDGTEFEIVAFGLRNPQELVFDNYGDLWTGDNNGDGGDKARWVYALEGSDSGWIMGWQHLPRMGAWNSEALWELAPTNTASYILPPVAHIGRGPAGISYYPGTGLPARYANHFFMADFPGGIRSFEVVRKNGFFEITDLHDFLWGLSPVDCDFGPHRGLYVADWVQGWEKTGKGRIFRVYDPNAGIDAEEVRRLLAQGFNSKPTRELPIYLAHPDQRVRLAAQFALVDRGSAVTNILAQVLKREPSELPRFHSIWALGQIGRKDAAALDLINVFASDLNSEIRAQAVRALGELGRRTTSGSSDIRQQLVLALQDPEPRVRMFAMQSLGRVGANGASEAIISSVARNGHESVLLRHAAAHALARLKNVEALSQAAQAESKEVRLVALLALRRLEWPEIAVFLHDEDPQIVLEAARAIHDLNITNALPQLASLLGSSDLHEFAVRRAVNANYRLGRLEHALAISEFASNTNRSPALRAEAIELLAQWEKPAPRDQIVGLWRPLPSREGRPATIALRDKAALLLNEPAPAVQLATVKATSSLKLDSATPALRALVTNRAASDALRVESLKALAALKDKNLSETARAVATDPSNVVRAEAAKWQGDTAAADPLMRAAAALQKGGLSEQQEALKTLAALGKASADSLLLPWVEKLLAGDVRAELQLDVLEAARARTNASKRLEQKVAQYDAKADKRDVLAGYRETLVGGNAEQGRKLFFERADAGCLRCHKVQGEGGEVGPELAGISARMSRDVILESILFPNNAIAPGFESALIKMKSGQSYAGIVQAENDSEITLNSPEDGVMKLKKAEVESRDKGLSAMPAELATLFTKRELRDLLEYLATLKP
ncbi:MAG TPA: PVC-type heme-binding CxxCH protein [Methylomirabilota bacterium]|nr:PVC-type heme-binding CxxCH protein [Methylomirabilota bacterium]